MISSLSLMSIPNQNQINMDSPSINNYNNNNNFQSSQKHRTCVDCHTTRTPLWRGGPAGPGSLCNACGIRYRKKRIEGKGIGVNKNGKGKKSGQTDSLKLRVVSFRRGMVLHTGFSMGNNIIGVAERNRSKFDEEEEEAEEAAMLLMALSSTYV